jgi:4a-hydroxytetrahydrobiopterin dehydratase
MTKKGNAMSLLLENEIIKRLENLDDWIYSTKQITKEFKLADFKEALAFVNKVGVAAEAMDHHPDILMHSWNKVKISISTHTEGGVTDKDFQLAEIIELLS